MEKTQRSWWTLYRLYSCDDSLSITSLILQGLALGFSAGACFFYFDRLTIYLTRSFSFLPIQIWSLLAGFVGGFMSLMSVCFLVTAGNLWHSGLVLYWNVCERMVAMVDWSCVSHALDVGSGSGMLLNSAALQLKKQKAGGHIVGVDLWLGKKTMAATVQNAAREGVDEYVKCKTGDPCSLPLDDGSFDVVLSALCLHKIGSEFGPRSSQAANQRLTCLEEIVRVLKPGGKAVVWDLCHVPEYRAKLEQLRMKDIHMSECIPAFMMQSHILSFKKPV